MTTLKMLEGEFGWCKADESHTQTILKIATDDDLARVVWCSCGKVIVTGHALGDPVLVVHDFSANYPKPRNKAS